MPRCAARLRLARAVGVTLKRRRARGSDGPEGPRDAAARGRRPARRATPRSRARLGARWLVRAGEARWRARLAALEVAARRLGQEPQRADREHVAEHAE